MKDQRKRRSSRRRKTVLRLLVVAITLLFGVLLLAYLANLFLGEGRITAFFQEFTKENKALSYVLYLVLTPLINIVPGISSMFSIGLANMLFNYKTPKDMAITFLLCAASVLLTSTIMFLIGRYGGKKIVRWILGRDEQEKIQKYLTLGGKAIVPVMYLLPFFPDDTLSLVIGLTNVSFLYNLVCTLLFRNFGVLFMCVLGTDFLDYSSFSPLAWTVLVLLFLLALSVLSFLSLLYYRHLRFKEDGIGYYLIAFLRVRKTVRLAKVGRRELKDVPLPSVGEGGRPLSRKEARELRKDDFLDGYLYRLTRERGTGGYFLLQDRLDDALLPLLSEEERERDYLVFSALSYQSALDFRFALREAVQKSRRLYVLAAEGQEELLGEEGFALLGAREGGTVYRFQG